MRETSARPAGRPVRGGCGSRRVDMRVSTLPTQFGEKVSYALLERVRRCSALSIWVSPVTLPIEFRKCSHCRRDATVTGPPARGRVRSLYSCLNQLP